MLLTKIALLIVVFKKLSLSVVIKVPDSQSGKPASIPDEGKAATER